MKLSDKFIKAKNSFRGNNYEVLSGGHTQQSLHKLECAICKDIFEIKPSSIFSGRISCSCRQSNKARNSQEKFERIYSILKSKDIVILTGVIGKAKDPINLQCTICDHKWLGSYNHIYYRQQGCPNCTNNIKPSEKNFDNQVVTMCEKSDLTYLSSNYKSQSILKKVRVKVCCNFCGHSWETSRESLRKSSCPSCAFTGFNTAKPAYLYVLRVCSSENVLLGYKYGITCNLERREYEHTKYSRGAGLHFELAYKWFYSEGGIALVHEKHLKEIFKSFFTKEQLPSGFTESIPIQSLPDLLDIQLKQYKEYKNGRID